MHVLESKYLFQKKDATGASDVQKNLASDTLTIIVSGSSDNFEIEMQVSQNGADWCPASILKLDDYSVVESISANGAYVCAIEGFGFYKAELKSITSGSVNMHVSALGE